MNLQLAQTMDASSDLRVLEDDELDAVNGGLFFLLGLLALSVGLNAGYNITSAILRY